MWKSALSGATRNVGGTFPTKFVSLSLLLGAVLDVARENVELIQLSVVTENLPARRLYESAGFLEFGMELKAAKHGDKYHDEAHMALDFRRSADLS